MSSRAYQNVKGSTTLTPTGARGRIQLDNRVQTNAIAVRVRTTLVVTGATTGNIRADGRPTNALRFAVSENGNDTIGEMSMRAARLISESQAGQAYAFTRPAGPTLAVGTHVFDEYFILNLSNPLGVDPFETAYKEADPNSFFTFEPLALTNLIDSVVDAGAAVVTASCVVEVEQHADPARSSLPWFKPRYREIVQQITGTNPADILNIRTRQRLSGILLMQEAQLATGGIVPVSDAITALRLIGDDGRNLIGPNQTGWSPLVTQQAGRQSGQIVQDAVFLNFQRAGRLSYTIVPEREYPNFRFELADLVSATGTTTRLRAIVCELTRTPPTNGYAVVAPPEELPSFLL